MHAALHQYKLRLTNLSQSNRSLKLAKLSPARDLDLTETSFANNLSPAEILTRVVAGRKVTLVKALSAHHEPTNVLDRRLNRIFREVRTIHEETGTYDLFVGYPFVEGRFLDGSVARCPVLLFPVRLVRNLSRSPRWQLEVPEGEPIVFNNTFFLAYEKFQQIRLERSFWEAEVEHANDLQELLNGLYAFFKEHELALHFDSELFQFQVKPFPNKTKAELESIPLGKLKFHSHAVLGIFPQSDSALLKDYEVLEEQAEQFRLDELFAPKVPGMPRQKYIPEAERFFVTPVDQSQEEALLAVKNGASIVLHGPPGTGKSQVIINLVADAMARGQRVLVCSQKRAALDVVYQRLEQLGLGRFAALVHDYRGDRTRIFAKIRQQLDDLTAFEEESRDLNLAKWERDFRNHARQIDEHTRFFDQLHTALVSDEPYGISPHHLYQMVLPDRQELPIQDLTDRFNAESLDQLLRRIRDVLAYQEFFAADYPLRNRLPMYRMKSTDQKRLKNHLQALAGDFHDLWKLIDATSVSFDHDMQELERRTDVYEDWAKKFEVPKLRQGWIDFYAQELQVSYIRRKLDSLENIFREMARFEWLQGFQMTLFHDLSEHVANYRTLHKKGGRLLSLKYLRAKWYLNALLKDKDAKVNRRNFKEIWAEFRVLERLMKHAESLEGEYFFEDLPLTDRPGALLGWVSEKRKQLQMIQEERKIRFWTGLKPKVEAGERRLRENQHEQFRERLLALKSYLGLRRIMEQGWKSWLHARQIETLRKFTEGRGDLDSVVGPWQTALERDFVELQQLDGLLAEMTVDERMVVERLTDQIGLVEDVDGFIKHLKDNILRAWIESIELNHPELLEVSSRRMPGRREDFRIKVRERQDKVVRLILRQLKEAVAVNQEYNRLGNPVTYREISHQVRKKRLLWSVRRLVREFWEESLGKLLPCWLASPESTAAIFPMAPDFFDLVIFDEASQCYVERALPVMLRGRQCVIAGDDQQLPPFDLYKVKVDENEAEIESVGVALEVESALDLARNIFSDQHLNWHYRSQEEELINFSNYAFYKGRLKVIPPARHSEGPPIEFIPVAGQWANNSNVAEAQKVVELVEKLIQALERQSIGIVTFNYHQRELIADLLEARMVQVEREGRNELAAAYVNALGRGKDQQPGIFVKNIENVQGDERDIIIFSVAYARNEAGRLVTHFGLLSQRGGENRLNVGVTRARQKIYVLASFAPSELDVSTAKHAGPRLFKKYLRYAQAVSAQQPEVVAGILKGLQSGEMPSERPFSDDGTFQLKTQLAERLRKEGLEVVEDVGETGYRVDLAIVGPQGTYRLGIELEGPNYFSGRSSKEREVYRLGLLEVRGWKIVRVWARTLLMGEKAWQDVVNRIVGLVTDDG